MLSLLALLALQSPITFLLQKTPKLLINAGKANPLDGFLAFLTGETSSSVPWAGCASCYRSFPTSVSLVAIFVQNYKRLRSKMLGTFMQKDTDSTCIQTIGNLQPTTVCFSLNVSWDFASGDPSIWFASESLCLCSLMSDHHSLALLSGLLCSALLRNCVASLWCSLTATSSNWIDSLPMKDRSTGAQWSIPTKTKSYGLYKSNNVNIFPKSNQFEVWRSTYPNQLPSNA